MQRRSIRRLSPFAEIIPEVIEYGHLDAEHELAGGSITVANGTSISGIDEVSSHFQDICCAVLMPGDPRYWLLAIHALFERVPLNWRTSDV